MSNPPKKPVVRMRESPKLIRFFSDNDQLDNIALLTSFNYTFFGGEGRRQAKPHDHLSLLTDEAADHSAGSMAKFTAFLPPLTYSPLPWNKGLTDRLIKGNQWLHSGKLT